MTKDKKINLIKKVIKFYEWIDDNFYKLNNITGCAMESPLFNGVYRLLDEYIDLVSKIVGDNHNVWIPWFIYDNECGKKELEAGFEDDFNRISTVEELVNIIEYSKEKIENELVFVENLSEEEAKSIVASIYRWLYYDHRKDCWTPDKELSGADTIEYLTGILPELRTSR